MRCLQLLNDVGTDRTHRRVVEDERCRHGHAGKLLLQCISKLHHRETIQASVHERRVLVQLVDIYQTHGKLVDFWYQGVDCRSRVWTTDWSCCLASSSITFGGHTCILGESLLLLPGLALQMLNQLRCRGLTLLIFDLLSQVEGFVSKLFGLVFLSIHGVNFSNCHHGCGLALPVTLLLSNSKSFVGRLQPFLHLADHPLALPQNAEGIGQEGFLPLKLLGDGNCFL
mmetsp:Transcript_59407/g.105650  ORF Transcript_59407/g.105650 Transcript_59407/m.105650 type:complete len:227 (-) Transcript_59407:1668-2348(-)